MTLRKKIAVIAGTILLCGTLVFLGIISIGIKDDPTELGSGYVIGFGPLHFGAGYNGRSWNEYDPAFCPESFRFDDNFILLYGRLADPDVKEEELHRAKYNRDRKILRERFSPVFYIVTKADGTVRGPMDLKRFLIARDSLGVPQDLRLSLEL